MYYKRFPFEAIITKIHSRDAFYTSDWLSLGDTIMVMFEEPSSIKGYMRVIGTAKQNGIYNRGISFIAVKYIETYLAAIRELEKDGAGIDEYVL